MKFKVLFAVLLAAIGATMIILSSVTLSEDGGTNTIITKTPSEITQFPLDLNKATKSQLAEIDGIGDVIAGRIVDYRKEIGKFTDVSQLINVEGIGPQKLEVLSGFLFVEKDEKATTTMTVTKAPLSSTKTTARTTTKAKTATLVTTAKTSAAKTTTKTTTTTKATTVRRERHAVKINSATLEEIRDRLLLTDEEAEAIVRLREQIQYFSNALEILYATDKQTGREIFSNEEFNEFKDYVIID